MKQTFLYPLGVHTDALFFPFISRSQSQEKDADMLEPSEVSRLFASARPQTTGQP